VSSRQPIDPQLIPLILPRPCPVPAALQHYDFRKRAAAQRSIDGRPQTTNPLSAAALICSANSAWLTWPAGSATNRSARDFMARATSEKKDAADGVSCTTANASTKSAIASESVSSMDVGLTTRVSILSKRPALRARRFRPSIIRGCTSTATTRPEGPTSFAISRVKKPMPGPGSSTVIPGRI